MSTPAQNLSASSFVKRIYDPFFTEINGGISSVIFHHLCNVFRRTYQLLDDGNKHHHFASQVRYRGLKASEPYVRSKFSLGAGCLWWWVIWWWVLALSLFLGCWGQVGIYCTLIMAWRDEFLSVSYASWNKRWEKTEGRDLWFVIYCYREWVEIANRRISLVRM